jgi:hypothetical protein
LNGRGETLTGEILNSFFNPLPEPSTLVLTGLAGGAALVARRRRQKSIAAA